MRRQLLPQSLKLDQVLQARLHITRRYALALLAQKKCSFGWVAQITRAQLEPAFDRADRLTTDRQISHLIAFAGNQQLLLCQVNGVEIDADQFCEAQPG